MTAADTKISRKPEPAGPLELLRAVMSAMLPLAVVVGALAALMPVVASS